MKLKFIKFILISLIIIFPSQFAPVVKGTIPLTDIDENLPYACGVYNIASYHPIPEVREKLEHYVYTVYINRKNAKFVYYAEVNFTEYNATFVNETGGKENISVLQGIRPVQVMFSSARYHGYTIFSIIEFIGLMMFNESQTTLKMDAPDPNDYVILFTVSPLSSIKAKLLKEKYGISNFTIELPDIYLIKREQNGTVYRWGITYKHLYLYGVRVFGPDKGVEMILHLESLIFYYKITFLNETAEISINYIIKPALELWIFTNNSGTIDVLYYNTANITQFINNSSFKLSMLFMNTINTASSTGESVENSYMGLRNDKQIEIKDLADISNSTIYRYAADEQKVFAIDFTRKNKYILMLPQEILLPTIETVHDVNKLSNDSIILKTADVFKWITYVAAQFIAENIANAQYITKTTLMYTQTFPLWKNIPINYDPVYISYHDDEQPMPATIFFGIGLAVGVLIGILVVYIMTRWKKFHTKTT